MRLSKRAYRQTIEKLIPNHMFRTDPPNPVHRRVVTKSTAVVCTLVCVSDEAGDEGEKIGTKSVEGASRMI